MAYVITDACADVKDKSCAKYCPVDCIYEGPRSLYIHPDECINCGLCPTVCPVSAIYAEEDLPADKREWTAVNAEFFGPQVTNLGAPGGADGKAQGVDHPRIAALPRKPPGWVPPDGSAAA